MKTSPKWRPAIQPRVLRWQGSPCLSRPLCKARARVLALVTQATEEPPCCHLCPPWGAGSLQQEEASHTDNWQDLKLGVGGLGGNQNYQTGKKKTGFSRNHPGWGQAAHLTDEEAESHTRGGRESSPGSGFLEVENYSSSLTHLLIHSNVWPTYSAGASVNKRERKIRSWPQRSAHSSGRERQQTRKQDNLSSQNRGGNRIRTCESKGWEV